MSRIEIKQVILRLCLAVLLGGIVGLEREKNAKPAGFRTNILVSVGAALIMIVSIKMRLLFNNPQVDPGRIAAQVVSGIGFLGAGTIIREGFTVKGLTTAAGIWAVSGIGLALGAGFYVSGVTAAVLVIVTLNILNKVETNLYGNQKKTQLITVEIADKPGLVGKIGSRLQDNNIELINMDINPTYERESSYLNLKLEISKQASNNQLLTLLGELEGVMGVKTENFD